MNNCMICKEILHMKDTQTIRIRENNDRDFVDIVGHVKCTSDLWKRMKEIKDMKKKSVKKVLEELGLEDEFNGN